MSISSKVIYGLECGHAAPGPATLVNGVLRCAWCQEPRRLVSVVEYEWRANCRNCRFLRWAGLSKHNAGIFAAAHSRKNADHAVIIEYARNPVAVSTAYKMKVWTGRKTG